MVRCGGRGGTGNATGDTAEHRADRHRDWAGCAASEEDGGGLCAAAGGSGESGVKRMPNVEIQMSNGLPERSVDAAVQQRTVRHRDYTFLGTTHSLCPECLTVVPAKIVARQSHLAASGSGGRGGVFEKCPGGGRAGAFALPWM